MTDELAQRIEDTYTHDTVQPKLPPALIGQIQAIVRSQLQEDVLAGCGYEFRQKKEPLFPTREMD